MSSVDSVFTSSAADQQSKQAVLAAIDSRVGFGSDGLKSLEYYVGLPMATWAEEAFQDLDKLDNEHYVPMSDVLDRLMERFSTNYDPIIAARILEVARAAHRKCTESFYMDVDLLNPYWQSYLNGGVDQLCASFQNIEPIDKMLHEAMGSHGVGAKYSFRLFTTIGTQLEQLVAVDDCLRKKGIPHLSGLDLEIIMTDGKKEDRISLLYLPLTLIANSEKIEALYITLRGGIFSTPCLKRLSSLLHEKEKDAKHKPIRFLNIRFDVYKPHEFEKFCQDLKGLKNPPRMMISQFGRDALRSQSLQPLEDLFKQEIPHIGAEFLYVI